jgi:hypothetical protein
MSFPIASPPHYYCPVRPSFELWRFRLRYHADAFGEFCALWLHARLTRRINPREREDDDRCNSSKCNISESALAFERRSGT